VHRQFPRFRFTDHWPLFSCHWPLCSRPAQPPACRDPVEPAITPLVDKTSGSLSPCGRGLGRGGLGTTNRLVRRVELTGATPLPTLSRKGRGRNNQLDPKALRLIQRYWYKTKVSPSLYGRLVGKSRCFTLLSPRRLRSQRPGVRRPGRGKRPPTFWFLANAGGRIVPCVVPTSRDDRLTRARAVRTIRAEPDIAANRHSFPSLYGQAFPQDLHDPQIRRGMASPSISCSRPHGIGFVLHKQRQLYRP